MIGPKLNNYHNCSVVAKSRFRIKRVSDFEVQVDLTATQEEEPLSREQLQENEVVCYLVLLVVCSHWL